MKRAAEIASSIQSPNLRSFSGSTAAVPASSPEQRAHNSTTRYQRPAKLFAGYLNLMRGDPALPRAQIQSLMEIDGNLVFATLRCRALRERTAVIVTLGEEVHLSCFQVVDCSYNLYRLCGLKIAKHRALRPNGVDCHLDILSGHGVHESQIL